jgi:regulator of RNase E activity RraA
VVQPGDLIVGDEDGLVVFAPSEADRLISAAERTAAVERAIREEILTGNVRQSWMDRIFAARLAP